MQRKAYTTTTTESKLYGELCWSPENPFQAVGRYKAHFKPRKIGCTPKGSYSPRGRSRHLLETPFSEPLLRTLLRTLFCCKTQSTPPPQNPSENPPPRTLPRTFSEPFLERCVAVRPLRRAPKKRYPPPISRFCGSNLFQQREVPDGRRVVHGPAWFPFFSNVWSLFLLFEAFAATFSHIFGYFEGERLLCFCSKVTVSSWH